MPVDCMLARIESRESVARLGSLELDERLTADSADHGRLKARLRPMRGLKRDRTASTVIKGHAFIQNVRRGHYELGLETTPARRIEVAFDELLTAIR